MSSRKEQPIQPLACLNSFKQLSDKEKLYAYHLNQAMWAGLPIVIFQISEESPALFNILQSFFTSMSPIDKSFSSKLKEKIPSLTDDDIYEFLLYCSKFYSNVANYLHFGHKKFIPKLSKENFQKILELSPSYKNEIEYLWNRFGDLIYNDSPEYSTINLNEKGGKNSYYLGGMTEKDIEKVDSVLKSKEISLLNTRILKLKGKEKYVVLIGSIDKRIENITEDIIIYYGEFDKFLTDINIHLTEAKKYAANELEEKMIDDYIESFKTGSIEKHKDSQRKWVKDKSPVVEMNMGWIETYIDPMGVRAYYEGWVAFLDKAQSLQFKNLVLLAPELLKIMPWPKEFEKEVFCSPDFTALDFCSFASDGCPLGINIPNYDDVQAETGFKNINVSNGYPKVEKSKIKYSSEEDKEILSKLSQKGNLAKTACHELLGHGSGILLRKDVNGKFNFDENNLLNPLTNQKIKTYYNANETFEEKFTTVGRSYEECRADTTAFYLCFEKKVLSTFGVEEKDYEDTIYTMYLNEFRKGILGLPLYNKDNKKWGQAHCQCAFVFMNFILLNQKKGKPIVNVNLTKDGKSFIIGCNKENLLEYGRELAKELLLKLHIWKSIGDSENGFNFYNHYSEPNEMFLKIRQILIDDEIPRRLQMYCNLKLEGEKVEMKEYEESFEGIIQSYVERFGISLNEKIKEQIMRYDDENFLK